jgi:hypothetical protein
MDSVPPNRKINRYCQMLGMTDSIHTEFPMNSEDILNVVSDVKYYSLNAFHFVKGGAFNRYNVRKKTIEFRIGENAMCLDGFAVKNWVRLLLHFVEMTKNKPLPPQYKNGDPWNGLVWLEPVDVFKVMGFDQPCSEGLNQVKTWFIKRILENGQKNVLPGVWSHEGREAAKENFLKLLENIELSNSFLESRESMLYGKNYVI